LKELIPPNLKKKSSLATSNEVHQNPKHGLKKLFVFFSHVCGHETPAIPVPWFLTGKKEILKRS